MTTKPTYEELENRVKELERETFDRELVEERIARFGRIFEDSLNEIYLFEPGTLLFTQVNKAAQQNLGYTMEELRKLTPADLKPEFASESFEELLAPLREGKKKKIVFETVHRRKDHSLYDVEVHLQLLNYENEALFVAIILDITKRKEAEEALGKSEERYRNLVENSLNAIILYRQKEILFANEPFFHIFGYERGELQGIVVDDLLAPEVADGVAELRQRRLGGKIEKAAVYESKGIRSNGEIFDMEISVCVIPYQGAQCCMAFLSDVSKRKEAEKALGESEEKFRLTYSSSPDAININRLRDGLYVDINDGFTLLTGFTREDIVGKTSLDIQIWYDPADRVKMVQELQKYGFCDNLEASFRRKDGSLTTALMSARVISLNNEPHIISITRDISERKKAEAERERLLLAIEQANEIVVISDVSGTIQYVNPAFEKITGYSNREVIGANPRLLKSGHHNEAFYKDLWDTILAGNPWTGRLLNKRKNGALYTGESSISPVKDENGNVMNFVWISRDITNELELEKRVSQAQKMEAIGALAGGIAHDFNNLLFPIMGLSEMLMEDLPSGTLHYENAKDIFNAARRAGDLVNQILSFSRQSDHKKTPVMIQQILREVNKLARATIPSNIEIAQGIQNDCGLVMADPTQIHQIAMNLITNAYHAVEQDGGKILIKLTEIELKDDNLTGMMLKPGRYALMTISDTGHGIDPAIIGKIFEPYFTTKAQGKGTGLGLSVVYKIVTEHGGDILVSSEVDKGTTFSVYLPIMKEMALSLTPDTEMVCKTGTEKILLVDDDAAIVRLEKQVLESLGYMVEAQTSSMEALHMFRARPDDFDVVISDMTMPNLTGDQLAEELISIKPSIPVIICTGFSNKMNKKRAAEIGVKGLLMKPITKSEIAYTLRKVLDDAKNSSQE